MTERYVNWIEYVVLTDCIVNRIKDTQTNKEMDFIYGIPRGGLIPATILSYKFNIPILNVTSSNIIVYQQDETICIVDDILDSGKTLDGTIRTFLSRGFDKFKIFTLFAKPKGISYFLNSRWKDMICYEEEIPDDCWIHFPYEWDPIIKDSLSNVKQPGA